MTTKRLQAIALAVITGGCSTVKVVQRDGCWVRRTERAGNVKEELGPCARPAPKWADDRLTRLVQECAARGDWVWETRAVAAWNRGEALPPQEPQEEVLRRCLADATSTILGENEGLKARLAEVTSDRDALRARSEQDGEKLREANDRIAEYLGDAAKKPSPPAVATATSSSDGTVSSESSGEAGASPSSVAGGAPGAVCEPPETVAVRPGDGDRAGSPAKKAGAGRRARKARLPACDPAPVAVPAAGGTPESGAPRAAGAKPEAFDPAAAKPTPSAKRE